MKRYYAANNAYGSDTSIGFANTWDVYVFNSKAERDTFVENGNMSTRIILRNEVTQYANNWSLTRNEGTGPKAFSGEYWGINDYAADDEQGVIGIIECCNPDETHPRFYG